jgi:hypothetical protein
MLPAEAESPADGLKCRYSACGWEASIVFFLRQHDQFTPHEIMLCPAQLGAGDLEWVRFMDSDSGDARGF